MNAWEVVGDILNSNLDRVASRTDGICISLRCDGTLHALYPVSAGPFPGYVESRPLRARSLEEALAEVEPPAAWVGDSSWRIVPWVAFQRADRVSLRLTSSNTWNGDIRLPFVLPEPELWFGERRLETPRLPRLGPDGPTYADLLAAIDETYPMARPAR